MKITVLGSGTSSGVPTIGCSCKTCRSDDPRDKRLRPSLLLEIDGKTIVFDTSADFRQQMLRYDVQRVDAIVYTHHHFDHIAGLDDVRAYNFHTRSDMPVFALRETMEHLERTFPYAFTAPLQLGGGVPMLQTHIIDSEPFDVCGIQVQPIPMMHGKMAVNGYRVGRFAYCTDTNFIPDSSLTLLENLDILILDALRYHPHPTHFTVEEAIRMAQRIGARETYFTHIAHEIRHADLENDLPEGVFLSFDGLRLEAVG